MESESRRYTLKDLHLGLHLAGGDFDTMKGRDVKERVAHSPTNCPFCGDPWPAERK